MEVLTCFYRGSFGQPLSVEGKSADADVHLIHQRVLPFTGQKPVNDDALLQAKTIDEFVEFRHTSANDMQPAACPEPVTDGYRLDEIQNAVPSLCRVTEKYQIDRLTL